MRQFLGLTALFLKQLVRRKSLWAVVAVVGAMLLVGYLVQKQMDEALRDGVRYDVATRRAASTLDAFASQIRGFSVALVLLVSALVAPAARKDGTAQFLLSLSVGRYRLAAAQFAALSAFLSAVVFVIHAGYVFAARDLGVTSPAQIGLAWATLLGPLGLAAAVVFSLSLSRPAMVVYAVLIAVPYVALPLAEAATNEWPQRAPFWAPRLVDGLEFLFPKTESVILWPRLGLDPGSGEPPVSRWGWTLAQHGLACTFWIALGLWLYRGHDLGSRTPTK
jgi:ABC-type transport system involved in multi-copper enzyme maturation permease subunit